MKQFTFGVLAYNVEPYIIECLESIKYQVESFGDNYSCNLLIAEDCSTDRTLELIEYWVQHNKSLFFDVEIIKNVKNKGLVQNIIGLYKKINTINFKVIDGDDIFYKNNIFDLLETNDIVITETIHFKERSIVKRGKNYFLDKLLLSKSPIDILKDVYRYTHIVDTPGVFFRGDVLGDDLYNAMGAFKMLDDIPRWKYIFNQNIRDIYISDQPYILYRIGSGVSTNSLHEKRVDFNEDVLTLNKNIKRDPYFKRRLNRLKHSCFKIADKFYYSRYSSILKKKKFNFSQALNEEGNQYLQYIIEKSEEFKKKFEQNC